MAREKDLGYYLTHPWALVSYGIASLSSGFGFLDPVIGFVVSSAGTLFSFSGALATLGRTVEAVPSAVTDLLVPVMAAVYAGVLVYRLAKQSDSGYSDS